MHRRLSLSLAILVLAACSESTTPSLLSDAQIEADVAATSGAAIALEVDNMIGHEAGGPFAADGPAATPPTIDVDVVRTRTCYDASDAVQANCDPQTTARVVITMTADGTISDTTRDGGTFSAAIHRVRDHEISGLLGSETTRIHNGVGTSEDTTRFSGPRGTRDAAESAVDSMRNIVFQLPRSSNPWPVSGSIVRRVSGTVTLTGENREGTRSYDRRVEVVFPADAQGNVTIYINDRTCNLNLVTRRVTSCE
jgi:hypothetical protein